MVISFQGSATFSEKKFFCYVEVDFISAYGHCSLSCWAPLKPVKLSLYPVVQIWLFGLLTSKYLPVFGGKDIKKFRI